MARERRRVVIDAVGEHPRLRGDVRELRLGPAEPLGELLEARVEPAERGAPRAARPPRSPAPRPLPRQRVLDRLGATRDRLAVLGRAEAGLETSPPRRPAGARRRSRRPRAGRSRAGGPARAGRARGRRGPSGSPATARPRRATRARTSARPPNASSRSRCQRSSSSRCWSCWPWISTNGPTASASRAAVTVSSSSRAVERPPAVSSRTAIRGSGTASNSASTRAPVAPWRTSPVSARPPRTSPSASMSRLLPAPVSPVSTFSPGSSSRRTRSMSARSRTDEFDEPSRAQRGRRRQHVDGGAGRAHDGSSSTLWRTRSQNGSAPRGSTRRMGRSIARTSTTSPTSSGDVLAAVDAEQRLRGRRRRGSGRPASG